MSKNNSKSLIELKHKKLLNNEQGFSLLELVTAVGVVLVLTLIGLLSYNGITKNARQAAVNNTADTVYNRAMAYETDANPNTNYQTALEEYNKTSGSLDNDNTKKSITVEGTQLESNSLRIRAFYTNDESIEAIKTTPNTSTTNNDTGGNDTTIPPVVALSGTILNYKCDEDHEEATFPDDTNPYVNVGLSPDAVVKLTGTDGTNKEATGAGISHAMDAGVEYQVTINGKFQILRGNNCLRSIDNIDNNSGVTTIMQLGANITEVPNQIPDSVTSMTWMFYGAKKFNWDISGWDVSNVKNMSSMFYGATNFNQDISGWNVSNVTNMSGMFTAASKFDQDVSGWDVSNVKYMNNMFGSATAFNNGGQPLDWGNKTANVEHMTEMFSYATAFDQDISDWNVSKVSDMSRMFSHALAFNRDISDWDVSKVRNMNDMFYGASSFNNGGQPLNWGDRTANVTNMENMLRDASSFNQNISGWNVGNVSNYSNFANGSGIAGTDYIPAKFR